MRTIDSDEIKIKVALVIFLAVVFFAFDKLKSLYGSMDQDNLAICTASVSVVLIFYIIYDIVQKVTSTK